MAKKKNVTAEDIINFYMDFVLENEKQPSSVYKFSKINNFEESIFYNFFNSFDTLEKHIFNAFYNHTIKALETDQAYSEFDSRTKLLSFYYTFFEMLTANRSYVVYALNKHKNKLKSVSMLSNLKNSFSNYIIGLDIDTIDLKQEKLEKIQQKTLKESAWIQLLITIKFWLDDTSSSFEKTDIFIEKSVNTTFDLLDTKPLQSIIDLGKFIYKEKINMNL
ncbi:MAG: TetR family transcriptional regulator C-terminal domain-containing protein [Cellulophaga sp.]|uniref:TetR family transcriptional regulator C-terminal domain-containing protein n=1 Tax=unclassified Cellulophaga TaxID=2634405 RepID=UPI0026E44B73|nr:MULTISPECIES: TetR family transcriptional regulator C-terminal domain-containing protein [unclassified Cellulophaga]MDO6490916.1 TetR family transcriptional regulator C-terminal domain-containing protein [Cellulophaga sp. 2_MG-2023]MDO6493890.1 TetR family transcriptional regulator C-terminal domain-containing protein [Cellulophaga sp. 3_MG-2023]